MELPVQPYGWIQRSRPVDRLASCGMETTVHQVVASTMVPVATLIPSVWRWGARSRSAQTPLQLGRSHYQVLVANLPLHPLNLWRFYNDRADVELLIKQLKGNYALGHIPSSTSSPTRHTSI